MLVIGNAPVLTTAPALSVTKAFTCNYCSELNSGTIPFISKLFVISVGLYQTGGLQV